MREELASRMENIAMAAHALATSSTAKMEVDWMKEEAMDIQGQLSEAMLLLGNIEIDEMNQNGAKDPLEEDLEAEEKGEEEDEDAELIGAGVLPKRGRSIVKD